MSRISAVFLGSPEFAVPSLKALIDARDIDVPLVVTQPDRRAGRGRGLRSPAVKIAADQLGIPVTQPESLRSEEAIRQLSDLSPDIIVVVSFGEILRRTVLELPRHGCLNVHPSLLPRYRGAIPIPATILNGDCFAGVSMIKLVRQMDAGPVLFQTRVDLDGTETTGMLSERLGKVAAEYLPGVVTGWVRGSIDAVEQDHSSATYTRELHKDDAQIDWRWPADYIERIVRAMDPWPRAWTVSNAQRLAVLSVVVATDSEHLDRKPGTVVLAAGVVTVVTGRGAVILKEVQPAGKKPMSGSDWLRGIQADRALAFENPVHVTPPIIITRT